jgi:hypothetical protein
MAALGRFRRGAAVGGGPEAAGRHSLLDRGYQAGEFADADDIGVRITGQKPTSVHDYVVANRGIFQPGT